MCGGHADAKCNQHDSDAERDSDGDSQYYDNSKRCVEAYFPETDEWEIVPSMSQKREWPAVVAVDGYLYAITGYDEEYVLNCVRTNIY